MSQSNNLVLAKSQGVLQQMKAEIAHELGVHLGADSTARQNGSVVGEMTKRLVELAQLHITQ